MRKATLPVAETGEIVAVRYTAWAALAGFGLAVKVTDFTGAVTVTVNGADKLAPKLESPPYIAVIMCVPCARELVVMDTLPLLTIP